MPISETIAVMAAFPEQMERTYHAVPKDFVNWAPESWEGIPSETFTAIEQICHLRDIEIDGYQVRRKRMVEETNPSLESIDSYALARQRHYSAADPLEVLNILKSARNHTLQTIRSLAETQLSRTGFFEGYGSVTVRALIHYLCSHDQQHLSGIHWLLGKIDSHRTLPSR